MKKFYIFTCFIPFIVASCNNEMEEQGAISAEVECVRATIKDFEFDKSDFTRTSITIKEDGPHYAWATTDTIGIFPSEGRQVEFSMASGAGSTSAIFTGGGWGLKSTSTYSAYYPLIGKYYLDKTKIPVDYTGQIQNGNNSTAHLGTYDYLAAPASKVNNGTVSFNFERLGCLVQLKIKVPNKGTLSSVTLSCDEEILVEKGYIDLSAATPSIVPTQTTSSLNIDLKNVTTATANEDVVINFMMAPVDMSGKILTIKVGNTGGKVNAKNFEKGKAYQLVPQLHEAIDLGLSVKWASCNIGALSPEEFGNYYAWGETETKTYYAGDNSKWWNVKYVNLPLDSEGNIQSTYDAAIKEWGNSWRLPTKSELDELKNNCYWEWSTINGVKGYKLTSKINNNSIFLPSNDSSVLNGKETGFGSYWSSTPCSDTNLDNYGRYAGALGFYAKDYNISEDAKIQTEYFLRWCERGIRPVFNE